MSRERYRVALVVALVTALVAIFSRYENATYEITGLSSICGISEVVDCDAVQTSVYAKLLGVSLATWGALGASILFFWLLASRHEPALLVATGAAAALAIPMVLYTAFASWIGLGKVCLWCSVMQAGFVAFAILVVPAAWRARTSLPRRPLLLAGTTAAILLVLALSGEAYASQRIRFERMFGPFAGKGLRLDVSDSLILGDPATPVSVVIFFDFGCPHCRECVAEATELVHKFPDGVHVRFKHFPLEVHCNPKLKTTVHTAACRAAWAGQAAQSLGRDAEALKSLFAHQEDGFSKLVIARVGEEIGAPATWMELVESPAIKDIVARDIAEGNELDLGRRGVPVAFVNGRQVEPRHLKDTVTELCR